MAKKQSAIGGGFEAAAGTIWVVPCVEEALVGGMRTGEGDKELPKGTVVAVGEVPKQFKGHRLALGHIAVYARTVANVMKMPVMKEDGSVEEMEVKCVLWTDLRADFPPPGVTGGTKNPIHEVYQKVRGYLLRFSIPISIGFIFGFAAFPLIWSWSWLRGKVFDKVRGFLVPRKTEN